MAERNAPNLMPHRPNNEASLPRLLVFDLEGTLPNGSGVSAQKMAMQAILARARCNPMDYTALATGATHDLARAVLEDGGYLSYFNVLRAVDGLNTQPQDEGQLPTLRKDYFMKPHPSYACDLLEVYAKAHAGKSPPVITVVGDSLQADFGLARAFKEILPGANVNFIHARYLMTSTELRAAEPPANYQGIREGVAFRSAETLRELEQALFQPKLRPAATPPKSAKP